MSKPKDNVKISLILFFGFLVFYTIQIPLYSSKPDVLVFAIRALSDKPITGFAYLDQCTLLSGEHLPNYHLGHTLILWLVYHIIPNFLTSSIWASGFVSAISGALIVVLTFLIWRELKIDKKKALFTAVIVGLIPTYWEQSIIGEVNAIQFLFILLFNLSFLKNRLILSTLFFMFANLISPLAALSFGFILLKGINKDTIFKAFWVGLISLILYLLIFFVIGINLANLTSSLSQEQPGRGIIYRTLTLLFFIILNFNFFIWYLFKGIKSVNNEKQNLFKNLLFGITPQFLLIFAGSTFFIELGSFQMPIFWAFAFPLGYYLSKLNIKTPSFIIILILSLILSYSLWIMPNTTIGKNQETAGIWLKEHNLTNLSVVGSWRSAIGTIKGRDGSSLDALNKYYIDQACPTEKEIQQIGNDSLILVTRKRSSFRTSLAELGIPGFKFKQYNPSEEITSGTVKKLYENGSVILYKWEK